MEINQNLINIDQYEKCIIEKDNENYKSVINELIHFTNANNLDNILDSGYLYNQPDRQNISYQRGMAIDERSYCDSCSQYNSSSKCTEAEGVYFRILSYNMNQLEKDMFYHIYGVSYAKLNACLHFSTDLLKDKYWHYNICDNYGFRIINNKNFTNECKNSISKYKRINNMKEINTFTFTDKNIKDLNVDLYKEIKNYGELILKDSIPLKYLTKVTFYYESDYQKYIDKLTTMNIKCELFKEKIEELNEQFNENIKGHIKIIEDYMNNNNKDGKFAMSILKKLVRKTCKKYLDEGININDSKDLAKKILEDPNIDSFLIKLINDSTLSNEQITNIFTKNILNVIEFTLPWGYKDCESLLE